MLDALNGEILVPETGIINVDIYNYLTVWYANDNSYRHYYIGKSESPLKITVLLKLVAHRDVDKELSIRVSQPKMIMF